KCLTQLWGTSNRRMSMPLRRRRQLQSASALYRDVLVGCGIGEARYPGERRFTDARSDAVDEAQLPYRRIDRSLVNELLHLVQRGFTPLGVEFDGLLLVKLIKVGVAAVDIGSAFDVKCIESGGSVA